MESQTLTSKFSDFGCKFQNVAKSKVWHQSMTAANGSIRSSDSFCLARWPTGSELSKLSWLQTCCCRLETREKQKAYFVDRFKQTERIHILADWIKVVAFAFVFLQCCLCCRPAGLFKSFSRPRRGVEKKMEVEKKICWGLKQDKPSARSGKRHFGVEKKSSPLQALPQAARIALHEQLRAPLELQGDSARNLALC